MDIGYGTKFNADNIADKMLTKELTIVRDTTSSYPPIMVTLGRGSLRWRECITSHRALTVCERAMPSDESNSRGGNVRRGPTG